MCSPVNDKLPIKKEASHGRCTNVMFEGLQVPLKRTPSSECVDVYVQRSTSEIPGVVQKSSLKMRNIFEVLLFLCSVDCQLSMVLCTCGGGVGWTTSELSPVHLPFFSSLRGWRKGFLACFSTSRPGRWEVTCIGEHSLAVHLALFFPPNNFPPTPCRWGERKVESQDQAIPCPARETWKRWKDMASAYSSTSGFFVPSKI